MIKWGDKFFLCAQKQFFCHKQIPDQFIHDLTSTYYKTLNIKKENCFATGWGKDRFGRKGEYKPVLKQVELDMVGHKSCEEKLKETRLTKFFELHDSFICAGGQKGLDLCTGDGGGPLVCPRISDPDVYVQVICATQM